MEDGDNFRESIVYQAESHRSHREIRRYEVLGDDHLVACGLSMRICALAAIPTYSGDLR